MPVYIFTLLFRFYSAARKDRRCLKKDFVSPILIFGLLQKQDKDIQNKPLMTLILVESKMAYKGLN